jgi:hypothetical protein
MGIRLECPNGHKLHVKSFLAGKRGICPDCGAKFIIPSASQIGAAEMAENGFAKGKIHTTDDEPAAAISKVSTELASTSAPAAGVLENVASAPPADPVPLVVEAPVPPIAQPAPAVWYLRPEVGGQFGPATEETLKMWIAEGRVTENSLLWCNGWPEWKAAREIAHLLSVPLVAAPTETSPLPAEESVAAAVPDEVNPAEVQATRALLRRRRAQRARLTLTWVLLAAVVVLAGLLIWVLMRDTGQSSANRRPEATQLVRSVSERYVADGAGET